MKDVYGGYPASPKTIHQGGHLCKRGIAPGLLVGVVEIDAELETGKVDILDLAAVADRGAIVLHPRRRIRCIMLRI